MLSIRLISALALYLLVSCVPAGQLAEVEDVDPSGWGNPLHIPLAVNDPSRGVDMHLLFRYDGTAFEADSLELLVSTITPDSVMWSEHFAVAMPEGSDGASVVEFLYRENIKWSQKGDYQVILHPQHIYKGISAAGINIVER